MIFDRETIAFEILDVFRVSQKQTAKIYNTERTFDALSFRFTSDTVIETASSRSHIYGGSVCFFPAAMDYVRLSKKEDLVVIHFRLLNYPAKDFEYFYPSSPEKYASLFEEIFNCWTKKASAYKHEAASILYRIFAECYADNQHEKADGDPIRESILYIDQNCLQHDFSLSEAAKCSFMSEGYFRRVFKKFYQISPKQYVIKKRITHAASLISTGYYSLETVAEMCGYNDYKYFSVEFKRMMGVSPSKYTYDRDSQKSLLLPHTES